MDPIAGKYVALKTTYKLKEVARDLGRMRKLATELAKYDETNMSEGVINGALKLASENADDALMILDKLNRDIKGYLRRV